MSVHLFVGALLIPPVLVKLGSTGYRFARYYARDPVYRTKGPPPALLRAMGPFVVVLTVVLFASGIALMVAGPSSKNTLHPSHKIGFIVWLAFLGVHVLAHALELPPAVRADLARTTDVPGRSLRWMLLGVALGPGAHDGRSRTEPAVDAPGRGAGRRGRTRSVGAHLSRALGRHVLVSA